MMDCEYLYGDGTCCNSRAPAFAEDLVCIPENCPYYEPFHGKDDDGSLIMLKHSDKNNLEGKEVEN